MSLEKRLAGLHDRISEIKSHTQLGLGWFSKRKETEENAAALQLLKSTPGVGISVATILDQLKIEVGVIMEDNRIEFKEVVQFAVRAMQLLYTELSAITTLDPEARKAVVLLSLDEFYSSVLAPLDIPYAPAFLESSIIDPALGKLWHQAVDGLYDAVENMLNMQ